MLGVPEIAGRQTYIPPNTGNGVDAHDSCRVLHSPAHWPAELGAYLGGHFGLLTVGSSDMSRAYKGQK